MVCGKGTGERRYGNLILKIWTQRPVIPSVRKYMLSSYNSEVGVRKQHGASKVPTDGGNIYILVHKALTLLIHPVSMQLE